jgi:ABC-type transport system involved in Fe-S cluster assembly fused permease/ATPase subunit
MQAGKICVLHRGKLVEEGDHSDLMSLKGAYYKLWQQQMPVADNVAFLQ